MALKRFAILLVTVTAFGLSACAPLFDEHYRNRGGGYYPGPGAGQAAFDHASRYGYRDGYELGHADGRDRDRYEPRSHRWYRAGDRGYSRSLYVSRLDYSDVYRRAFLSGYDVGYREGQNSRRRGWRW
jgi:hypothetical protein